MWMFNDISHGTKDNERECMVNAEVVSICAKKFGIGQWSFIGPGSEKKWYSMEENSPQGIWDRIAEKMLLEFAESCSPIFRATTERIGRLSQTDKVSEFYMDAGFLSVVEIGQYFMTKDKGEQFYAMACREYTLPRNEGSSQPKGWIQRNTKNGPVLEVTTSCLYGKHGVEIRIWSLSEDNTHSWVRISHGSNIFVMDSNNNDTEVSEDQLEEYALQLDAKDFACRSKARAKPQRREPASYSPRIIPMDERNWIDIEPGNHSLSLCVRGFEASNPSSSTFSTSTTRRLWSGSFLEN